MQLTHQHIMSTEKGEDNAPTCHNIECFNTTNLKLCAVCRFGKYCSVECQTKDWSLHKKYCKQMKKDKMDEKEYDRTHNATDEESKKIIKSVEKIAASLKINTITLNNRQTEAILYNIDTHEACKIMKDENITYWNKNIPESVSLIINRFAVCKRIIIIIYNGKQRITTIICDCEKGSCTQKY